MMKKSITLMAVISLLAMVVFAETDAKARSELESIRKGKNNSDQIQVLRVRDSGVIDDKKMVVTSSTTVPMVSFGTGLFTNQTLTVCTQTLSTVYTTAPKVFLQGLANSTNNVVPTAVASNQFTVSAAICTNFYYMTIEAKP